MMALAISRHRLEHRSQLLAMKITHRIAVLAAMLRPPGTTPPFTTQLTNDQALAFWRKNRYTPTGADILRGWQPWKVAQLDAWLAAHPDPALAPDVLLGGQGGRPIPVKENWPANTPSAVRSRTMAANPAVPPWSPET